MANNPTQENRRPDTSSATPQSSNRPGAVARRESQGLFGRSPFATIFQRWNDDMERLFEDFGFGGLTPRSRQSTAQPVTWVPNVEVLQRGNDLVVRAELPGLRKEDTQVDITDDVLTIQGERRQEHEEEREGIYRSERSYGFFHRAIPLPEGTISDSAKATFKDGVLEIVLQAPPREVSRGRRLEIKEA